MKKIIFAFLVMVLGAAGVQAEENNFEYDILNIIPIYIIFYKII